MTAEVVKSSEVLPYLKIMVPLPLAATWMPLVDDESFHPKSVFHWALTLVLRNHRQTVPGKDQERLPKSMKAVVPLNW